MTFEDLSENVLHAIVFMIIVVSAIVLAVTATYYLRWLLTDKLVECVDGQAYEVTIQGNVKYLQLHLGTKCEELK